MAQIHLSQIDMNLLVALDVLLEEQSVTRAAARLHVTQPAMSQSLARLRQLLGDPLLVRNKGKMECTPQAEHLKAPLRAALSQLKRALEGTSPFVPEDSTIHYRIGALDYAMTALIPSLFSQLHSIAPQIDLTVRSIPPHRTFEALDIGEIELGVGVFDAPPPHIVKERLYTERFISLVRVGHPLLLDDKGITPESFASYPHGLVSTTGEGEGAVDRLLREHQLQRRIAVRIPYFLSVPSLLQHSDLIFTMPQQPALRMAQFYPIHLFEAPLVLPTFPVAMVYSKRLQQEPSHQWLRTQVQDIAQRTLV